MAGVGMPHELLLNEFGAKVWDAFGSQPYQVGSSITSKTGWRDVDVRMILDDGDWDAMAFGEPSRCLENPKWISLCLAYSVLGWHMTGLPIDFQLQRMSEANAEFKGPRSALGHIPKRLVN